MAGQSHVADAAGAELFGGVLQAPQIGAGAAGLPRHGHSLDDAAGVEDAVKDAELGFRRQVADVGHLQAVAQIGLVAAVAGHSLGVGQTGKRGCDLELRRQFPDEAGVEALNQAQHVLLVDEAHFQIQLGEFRLAVGAEILIAEAAGDLEVAFHAADHQQLLELLGRLGQGVEAAGLPAAGHQVIPRAFGGAFDEYGGFDFQESPPVQIVADVFDDLVAQTQVALHGRAAQVKVAVAEAQAFVGVHVVGDVERRREGLVEGDHLFGHYFHVPGGQKGVFGALRPAAHAAADLHAPFRAQALGGVVILGGQVFGVQYGLHDAGAVAQVDKNDAAVVASPADPAGQGSGNAVVGGAQFAAVVGFQRINSCAFAGLPADKSAQQVEHVLKGAIYYIIAVAVAAGHRRGQGGRIRHRRVADGVQADVGAGRGSVPGAGVSSFRGR